MERTSIVLSNVHCPSCVSAITGILSSFSSAISKIDVSILTGAVSFDHPESLQLDQVCQELTEAGFQVQDDRHDPHAHSLFPQWLQTLQYRLAPGLKERRAQKAKHRDLCKACQAEKQHLPKQIAVASLEEKTRPMTLSQTQLVLDGMTCSSCVNSIKDNLLSLPGVQSANVVLLPPSAIVVHDAQIITPAGLVGEVEGAGYGAQVVSSDAFDAKLTVAAEKPSSTRYKATLSVGGMTCSSCVSSVSDAIKPIPGVESFSVDLINGSASVILARREEAQLVADEIESCGFDAAVVDISDLARAQSKDAKETRTVVMRVDGMFCHVCITKVNTCLSSLAEIISYEPITSVDSPITKITYMPSPPTFTLRNIKTAISNLGGFQMSIQHDLTLAQRAERAQVAERRRIIYRLVVTFLFAVPTFIVGVVGMSLLSKENSFRMHLMKPVWGDSTKASWIMLGLATPIQFGVGWFFYKRSFKSLRAVWRHNPQKPWKRVWFERMLRWGSMDSLVALGTSIGYIASVVYLALAVRQTGQGDETYFDVSVFLILFILCGRYLESLSKARTGDALRELAKTKPSTGLLYIPSDSAKRTSTSTLEVESDYLERGDLIMVQVGASPPVDAVLLDTSAESSFDESSLTGETRPVLKSPGDEIFAGTINAGPALCLAKVVRPPGSTVLDSVMASVRDAMSKKADIERVAESVTAYFVPAITSISLLTFIVWTARGVSGHLPIKWLDGMADSSGAWVLFAVQFAVATLVVACPCGIGLAAPTANLIGLGLAAQNGVLPQGGGQAFQEFSNIDHIVLDKTGTLTEGSFTVFEHLFFLAHADAMQLDAFLWTLIQVVEQASTHPIAEGVSAWCGARLEHQGPSDISVDLVSSDEVAGQGLVAELAIENARLAVHIGNQKMMAAFNAEYPAESDRANAAAKIKQWQADGNSSIQVAVEFKPTSDSSTLPDLLRSLPPSKPTIVATLGIKDPPRPESHHVISNLRQAGIHVWLVSGDHTATARSVGLSVGIEEDHIVAEALPKDKKKFVEDLQAGALRRKGRQGITRIVRGTKRPLVAFCGDGINDAAAIAASDVGIAMGNGSSVALTSADFCLLNSSLLSLLTLRHIAWLTIRKVLTNFGWALVYNVVLIPLAGGAFYSLGRTKLPPVWASLAMALSSVSVVLNSLLLRWTYRLPKTVSQFRREGSQ